MFYNMLEDPVVQFVMLVTVVVFVMDAYKWILDRAWNLLGGKDDDDL
jgi:hypothetical protein|tara:strand:- start:416 stop:556 length:141 start_codon:yes stop_codon:yes gene_type:complete